MECAHGLTVGEDSEWRFPYDKGFGELFDHVSLKNQADNKKPFGREEKRWWQFWR